MNLLILVWTLIGAGVFLLLLKIPPPYGRFAKRGWGPLLSDRSAWLIMEAPAPILFFVWFLVYRPSSFTQFLFFVLWEIHYIYRAFIYPFISRGKEKKTPLSILFSAIGFNLINATINPVEIFSKLYPEEWLSSPIFLVGLFLFISGFSFNIFSERKLLQIKKKEKKYKLPQGFPFEMILSPHYFGEIVEWGGWALITWSFAGFSFFLWTCANLIPRAIHHYRWYQENYPEIMGKRKAVIPFLI